MGIQFGLPARPVALCGGLLWRTGLAAAASHSCRWAFEGVPAGLDLHAEGFKPGGTGVELLLGFGLLGFPLPVRCWRGGLGRPVRPAGRPVVRCAWFLRWRGRLCEASPFLPLGVQSISACASISMRRAYKPALVGLSQFVAASRACWASPPPVAALGGGHLGHPVRPAGLSSLFVCGVVSAVE